MSEPFLAEIMIVGFNFAPRGYALCDGQLLPINQNQSLYSLLGTVYGGDGRTTFALPDMRGRTAVSPGNGSTGTTYVHGQKAGQENVVLTTQQIAAHSHALQAVDKEPEEVEPADDRMPSKTEVNTYAAGTSALASMAPNIIGNAGNSQGHPNMQPYLALNFCIALQGLFPSRN